MRGIPLAVRARKQLREGQRRNSGSHPQSSYLALVQALSLAAGLFRRGREMKDIFDLITRTADGAVGVDREQRIVLWNKGAEALFGFKAKDVLGQFCYEVIGGLDDSGCEVCQKGCFAMTAALQQALVSTCDLLVRTNGDRQTWVNVSTMVIPPKWRNLFVLVHLFRNIRHQKEMEGFVKQLGSNVLNHSSNHGANAPTKLPCPQPTNLTSREQEVLRLLAAGASTKAIGEQLFISPLTARNHIRNLLAKLGVNSRLEAVLTAYKGFWFDSNSS